MKSFVPRFLLGALAGAALVGLVHFWASGYDNPLDEGTLPESSLVPDRGAGHVELSFVTTGTGLARGNRIAQGLGGDVPVAFRVAVIEHPRGRVVFGGGLAQEFDQGKLGFWTASPFEVVEATGVPQELTEAPAIVVLPTGRWWHASGVAEWPEETEVWMSSSERWAATQGPWPGRYAIDRQLAAPLEERVERLGWYATQALGRGRSFDMFLDGSVVFASLRGSSYDEVACIVRLEDGRRVVLVGDSVMSLEQVESRLPPALVATWTMNRNSYRIDDTIRALSQAHELPGVQVVPLLDGALELPEWPTSW